MIGPTGDRSAGTRRAWRASQTLLLHALLLSPNETLAHVAADAPAVIAADQAPLLADMLGRHTALPGSCSFVSVRVDYGVAQGTYACPNGPVVIELHHPGAAPPHSTATIRFAVLLRSGSPPHGLVEAVLSDVRAREDEFQWTLATAAARGSSQIGLAALFGGGEEGHAFWLLTMRVNILVFLLSAAVLVARALFRFRWQTLRSATGEVCAVLALTILAAVLRFLVATTNLMDFGGIPYSRLLQGYKGYYGAAQFFSFFYGFTARDLEHAILLNRIAGTLTIPLVYLLVRRLAPSAKHLPLLVGLLFAIYPLHIVFSASDALAIFSVFLTVASYAMLAGALLNGGRAAGRATSYLGGLSGLALLTQVRYENGLFLIPPALVLWASRRDAVRYKLFLPSLAVATAFLLIYCYASFGAGISYTNAFRPSRNLRLVATDLALNWFMAVPMLLLGTLAISVFAGKRLGMLALLPWLAALILCIVASGDGHGAARIYANWLSLILPLSAYGFWLMLNAPQRLAKATALAALVLIGILPLMMAEDLAAEHLEILEHRAFSTMLASVPESVQSIIVPDDEVNRESGPTLELYQKYAMILASRPEATHRLHLVPLTRYLDHSSEINCAAGACAFFFGLPCSDQDAYSPVIRAHCQDLLRTHRLSMLDETTVVAAPFVRCSIYTGALRDRLCDPAVKPTHFALHRLEE